MAAARRRRKRASHLKARDKDSQPSSHLSPCLPFEAIGESWRLLNEFPNPGFQSLLHMGEKLDGAQIIRYTSNGRGSKYASDRMRLALALDATHSGKVRGRQGREKGREEVSEGRFRSHTGGRVAHGTPYARINSINIQYSFYCVNLQDDSINKGTV